MKEHQDHRYMDGRGVAADVLALCENVSTSRCFVDVYVSTIGAGQSGGPIAELCRSLERDRSGIAPEQNRRRADSFPDSAKRVQTVESCDHIRTDIALPDPVPERDISDRRPSVSHSPNGTVGMNTARIEDFAAHRRQVAAGWII